MQQPPKRFPSPSMVVAKLKIKKFFSLRWLFGLPVTPLPKFFEFGRARQHEGNTTQDFVIIISLHYPRWRAHHSGQNMQLESVKNDTKALLDHLGYRHDNKDGRRWYFLMDYDLDYKDESKVTQPLPRTGLPTRDTVLRTTREVTWDGGSGLIHFSGHCYFKAPGASELEYKADCIIYRETENSPRGPKAAYLVLCDGKRVYGKEFQLALQNNSGTSTITVVLDTCKAEAFIRDFRDLPIVYDAESAEVYLNVPISSQSTLDQLIVATAARADEEAWTFNDCGVLTFFLTKYLQKYPRASTGQLINYINAECQSRPDAEKRQRPRIWSRYPLNGPFPLLPQTTPPSLLHSWLDTCLRSATQYALLLQEFRPVPLSTMLV